MPSATYATSTPLRVCLRHPRSPFKERGQVTTQPYRLSALIKPIDALPSQIVKEHLQLSTLVAETRDQQRRLNAAAIDRSGGAERDRTDDLLLAKQALSQLSYSPGALAQTAQLGHSWKV